MSNPQLKYKLEQVKRFVVPNNPETVNGKTVYKLKCVSLKDTLVELECTAKMWADFQKFHPETRTKVCFYLKINDEGLVFDYAEVFRPPPVGMFKQEIDGRVIDSADRLIFERKLGEKEFDPYFTPDMVQTETVGQILAALNEAHSLEAGDRLGSKHKIYEISQREGKEVVIVDIGR